MGLFSFMSDAGKVIFGDSEQENTNKAETLRRNIVSLGINIDALQVEVDGENAKIMGTANSMAEKEKAILYAGNVKGISQIDDQINVSSTAPAQTEAKMYTVQSGDSLSKIAKAEYGDAMRYNEIFEANKPMLKDENEIFPGQVLRIPQQ